MPRYEVQLFAVARDSSGQNSILIERDHEPTAAELLSELGRRIPDITPLLPSCRLAVDGTYADPQQTVPSDSDVALIPPVSGG